MATTRLSPRLLDQRLDEGFDLLAVERFVRIDPGGVGAVGAVTDMPASLT